jgi:hypothetical protein
MGVLVFMEGEIPLSNFHTMNNCRREGRFGNPIPVLILEPVSPLELSNCDKKSINNTKK